MSALRQFLHAVGWPFRMLLIGLITFYRRFLSPMMGPRCKYYPSCSAYGLAAVSTHGAAKGSALAGWRLLRCNPFSKGGYDPVPAPGRWLPDVYPDGRPRPGAQEADRPAQSASKEA
jgi:putative membrane protein insertion efficiency factor